MMEQPVYTVKTEIFEGPLDLLLTLVEKRKLFINDISLSQVADDYVLHIKQYSEFPVGEVANFVLVASVLVLIKSKSLLPKLDLTQEEEASIEELHDRLAKYQRIKELSEHIRNRFGKHVMFPRVHVSKHIQPVFTPEKSITKETMHLSIIAAMKKMPKPEKIPKRTLAQVVKLEEVIEKLSERMTRNLNMSFHEFSGLGKAEKVTVVVSFLAMLELVKQGTIIVQQESIFSDITMETQQLGTPEY